MLTRTLPRALCVIGALATISVACSSAPEAVSPQPTAVAEAESPADAGLLRVNVGMILNSAAPTADRDARLAEVFAIAADAQELGVDVNLETVTIDDLDDVASSVRTLVNRGVTVIATSCDDSSMPAVVDSAIEAQLLAVTGCVTIPRPDLAMSSRLFIDLAGLNDSPQALARWASIEDFTNAAVISSELIPDVSNTCTDIVGALDEVDIALAATATFTGLVDDAESVVASIAEPLAEADAIVVCALAPSLGDVVFSLRAAGFEQPIMVPWFGDAQRWPQDTSDVFIFATASRYGDDPLPAVQALFDQVDDPEAVDIVAADTVAILANVADAAGSVGSRRLADTIRTTTSAVVSGALTIDATNSVTEQRAYRLLEVIDGQPVFRTLITEDGLVQVPE